MTILSALDNRPFGFLDWHSPPKSANERRDDGMLTERQLEVVFSVVYEYIQTGEPAGSRTISKKYLRGCSSATIRNEMADLEEEGYFYQPHTSAGRLPTSKAYRLYVDSINYVSIIFFCNIRIQFFCYTSY